MVANWNSSKIFWMCSETSFFRACVRTWHERFVDINCRKQKKNFFEVEAAQIIIPLKAEICFTTYCLQSWDMVFSKASKCIVQAVYEWFASLFLTSFSILIILSLLMKFKSMFGKRCLMFIYWSSCSMLIQRHFQVFADNKYQLSFTIKI